MNETIDSIKREFPELGVNIECNNKFKVCYRRENRPNMLTFEWVNDKLYFIKEFAEQFLDVREDYVKCFQRFNIEININHIAEIINLWIDGKDNTTSGCLNVLSQNPQFYHKSKLELYNDSIKLEFSQLNVSYYYNNILYVNINDGKYYLELKFKVKDNNIYLVRESVRIENYNCVYKNKVCDIQIEENEIIYLLNLWLNYGWYSGGKKFIEELLNEHVAPKSARKI